RASISESTRPRPTTVRPLASRSSSPPGSVGAASVVRDRDAPHTRTGTNEPAELLAFVAPGATDAVVDAGSRRSADDHQYNVERANPSRLANAAPDNPLSRHCATSSAHSAELRRRRFVLRPPT
ncbi:MAG: hypothetical protein KC543_07760, partial [Myxococcales bacterium]|nr:hypothetical protein [Myxococcales bacterium]